MDEKPSQNIRKPQEDEEPLAPQDEAATAFALAESALRQLAIKESIPSADTKNDESRAAKALRRDRRAQRLARRAAKQAAKALDGSKVPLAPHNPPQSEAKSTDQAREPERDKHWEGDPADARVAAEPRNRERGMPLEMVVHPAPILKGPAAPPPEMVPTPAEPSGDKRPATADNEATSAAIAHLLNARERSVRRITFLSFALGVVLPAFLAVVYFAFFASPRYLSEAKFVVRGTVEDLGGEATRFTKEASAFSAHTNNQESHIIVDHITSRGMMEEILQNEDLYALFRVPRQNPAVGRADDPAFEELLKVWRRLIKVNAETISGIIWLQVEAFEPADAKRLAEAIIQQCRLLVDKLTIRAREDRLERTAREVALAESVLAEIFDEFQRFRDQQGTVDANYDGLVLQDFAALLRDQRVTLQSELSTARGSMSEGAPAAQTLTTRIASLDSELRDLEAQIEGARVASRGTKVTQALMTEEELQNRRDIAIARVSRASVAQSVALAEADREQVFLMTYQQPTLSHLPASPDVLLDSLITFLIFNEPTG